VEANRGCYHMPMGTDSDDNATQPDVPDGWGVYQPGDVIDLGGSELKDKQGRTVMTFKFEGVVAGGSVAARLRDAQAAAIRDVLAYVAGKNAEGQVQAPNPE
jgi:hypothetical protein